MAIFFLKFWKRCFVVVLFLVMVSAFSHRGIMTMDTFPCIVGECFICSSATQCICDTCPASMFNPVEPTPKDFSSVRTTNTHRSVGSFHFDLHGYPRLTFNENHESDEHHSNHRLMATPVFSSSSDHPVDRETLSQLDWSPFGFDPKAINVSMCSTAGVTCAVVVDSLSQVRVNSDEASCQIAYNRVVKISLKNTGLSGTIGVMLGNLIYLNWLDLSKNTITGPIPSALSSLKNITYMDFNTNSLNGTIPVEICRLSQLKLLDLSTNQLIGTIPAELGWLTILTEIHLGTNALTGPIPAEVFNSTQLAYYSIRNNQLTGTIPSELRKLTKLSVLRLDNNQLTGTIPVVLGNLTLMTNMWLSVNSLTGKIPEEFGALKLLNILDLSHCQLTGTIPNVISTLIALKYLALQSNQLTGSISQGLGSLFSLVFLSLNSNRLSGSIPSGLKKLSLILGLDLGSNRLSGSIPPELSVLKLLTTLQLNDNHLTGTIPSGLSNLTSLRVLDLSSNHLTGSVDWKLLIKLPLLNRFNISYNNISVIESSPPLDCSVGAVQNAFNAAPGTSVSTSRLASVNLNNNQLRFDITEFFNCIQIVIPFVSYLDISSNKFYGAAVDQIFNTRNTQYVSGFWSSEKTLTALNFLNASSNQISGTISSMWAAFSLPLSLDLSSNQFSGTIPAALFDSSIVQLRASENIQLGGAIAIKFGEADFIDYLGIQRLSASTTTVTVSHLNLTCPVLARIETSNSLDIDIDYMQYRQCSCLPDTYVQFLPFRCLACPSRLICSQSLVSPVHAVQPGFYPVFTEASIAASLAQLVSNVVNATGCAGLVLHVGSKLGVSSFTLAAPLALNYLRDCQLTGNVSATVLQSQIMIHATPLRCRTTADCTGSATSDSSSIFACAVGRDSDSLLCSQCIPGYYLTANRSCLICPLEFQWLAPLVNCVIAAVVFFMLWNHSNSNGHRARAIFQVTMFWLQLLYVLSSLHFTQTSTTVTKATGVAFIDILLNLSTFDPLAVDCVWRSFHFAEQFYASFGIMSAMIALIVAIAWRYWKHYSVIAPRTGRSNTLISMLGMTMIPMPPSNVNSSAAEIPSLFAKIAYCLLRLMLALYLSLAQHTLQIFACEQQTSLLIDSDYTSADNIGIVSYMVAAPYIDCRSSQYTVLICVASFSLLVFIVAFPVMLLGFLYKLRKLFDPANDVPLIPTNTSPLSWMQYLCAPIEFVEYSQQLEIDMLYIFGFQLASVRSEMWWWPTGMLTLRSLVLAILVSAMPVGSVWLPLLIVMLLVVSLLFHTHYHPYHHAGDNYLETIMITHALLAYFAQIIVDALGFTGSDAGLSTTAGHTYIFHMFDPASVAAIGDAVNGSFTYILLFGAVAYYLLAWMYLDRSLGRILPLP